MRWLLIGPAYVLLVFLMLICILFVVPLVWTAEMLKLFFVWSIDGLLAYIADRPSRLSQMEEHQARYMDHIVSRRDPETFWGENEEVAETQVNWREEGF